MEIKIFGAFVATIFLIKIAKIEINLIKIIFGGKAQKGNKPLKTKPKLDIKAYDKRIFDGVHELLKQRHQKRGNYDRK